MHTCIYLLIFSYPYRNWYWRGAYDQSSAIYIYLYTFIYTYIYLYMYICMYIYMCIHFWYSSVVTYIYIYVYIIGIDTGEGRMIKAVLDMQDTEVSKIMQVIICIDICLFKDNENRYMYIYIYIYIYVYIYIYIHI
jgi:hypothetical protein